MEFVDHEFPTEGIPMGAVVTIFGTGAEMNNGAVITNEATRQKSGMGAASTALPSSTPPTRSPRR